MLAGSCSSSSRSLVGHRLTHRDKAGTKYKGKIFFLLFITSNSGQNFPFIMEFKLLKFERDHQIFSISQALQILIFTEILIFERLAALEKNC